MKVNACVATLGEGRERQEQAETTAGGSSHACYPEFAGPGGERYLKKLLRQILPMALYRTWEIFADHQARGNDCYLGISQLAALAGRSLRTMQKNMASLQAKQLLVERAERKVLRGRDGESTSRMVVVKDFRALYALAHEYEEWLHAETYIPPDRIFVPAITQEPTLVAKLRRFDTYRRVLYTHLPGPESRTQEEDRWFTAYSSTDVSATGRPDEKNGKAQQPTSAHTPILSAKEPAKEVSKQSPKRKNESSHRDVPQRDSFDSASTFSEHSVRNGETGARTLQGQPTSNGQSIAPHPRATVALPQTAQQLRQACSGLPPEHAQQASVRARDEASQEVQRARQAITMAQHRQLAQRRRNQAHDCPPSPSRPPDHPLACSFLNEIAAPFGDRNPQGSATRVLRIIASASLEDADVLLCLVRAATIARETRTLRPAHYDQETGRANRMPLFCTLFERFVQARVQHGTWDYSWQRMEDDLAADERLLVWWAEHQALFATETPDPYENQPVPVSDAREDQSEPEEASPPVVGWVRREAAHYWGEQLLEALLAAGYEASVRVHLEGQWYQLVLVGEGCAYVLETPQQVQRVIEQVKVSSNPL